MFHFEQRPFSPFCSSPESTGASSSELPRGIPTENQSPSPAQLTQTGAIPNISTAPTAKAPSDTTQFHHQGSKTRPRTKFHHQDSKTMKAPKSEQRNPRQTRTLPRMPIALLRRIPHPPENLESAKLVWIERLSGIPLSSSSCFTYLLLY